MGACPQSTSSLHVHTLVTELCPEGGVVQITRNIIEDRTEAWAAECIYASCCACAMRCHRRRHHEKDASGSDPRLYASAPRRSCRAEQSARDHWDCASRLHLLELWSARLGQQAALQQLVAPLLRKRWHHLHENKRLITQGLPWPQAPHDAQRPHQRKQHTKICTHFP